MIPIFITVRTASTRLPNKCLLPLGDCKVIEHVIRRCKHAEFRPIVCTTTNHEDTILEHIASIEDVEVFCGDIDPHKRWMQCAETFNIWSFHALDCDDPYFCPKEVERSYSFMNDLKLHCVMPTKTSSFHALGMMGTSISRRNGETKILPESLHQELKNNLYCWPRLTLDYEEDYWLLQTIARCGITWKDSRDKVEQVLNNSLYYINTWRNEDWRANQCKEILSANTTVTN
jgi:spore coat polysaccharide biosynthesis protein SpsF (cytidylyltransferase family)